MSETMSVREAAEQYFRSMRRKQQTPKTREWKENKMKFFVEWCEHEGIQTIQDVKLRHIDRFIDSVMQRPGRKGRAEISSITLRGYQMTVKGFISWCQRQEIIGGELSKKIELAKPEKRIIEIFTNEQIMNLFDVCKKEYNDRLVSRDKAILAVLFETGIRVSELCGLTLQTLSLDNGGYISVMGKGRKEREVGLGERATRYLRSYVSRYRGKHPGEEHVFLNRSNQPMTPNGIEQLFIRLGSWAKIEGVRCSAHTCRHTYAVNFLLDGGDIYFLSRTLGHEKVSITEVYLKAITTREVRSNGFSFLNKLLDK